MRNILSLCTFIIASFEAFAGVSPTNLGSISMGMSKAEYVSVIRITPVNCNKFRDREGKPNMSEMKYLTSEKKTLCWGFSFGKTGSIENIQVGGLSYDVIEANYESSKAIKAVGNSSKAIFFNDRLINLEITFPNVNLETLTAKYGAPKLIDYRKIEICKNTIGNEFKNNVGKLDAVWVNGEVRSILRTVNSPPRQTCTDGIHMQYYILEEPRQSKLIEDAIDKYRDEISRKSVKDSPF